MGVNLGLRVMRTVLSKIFGSKWEEVTEDRRKPYNEEFHDISSSSNIIWAIKSMKMR
jgi:hypothetical protein